MIRIEFEILRQRGRDQIALFSSREKNKESLGDNDWTASHQEKNSLHNAKINHDDTFGLHNALANHDDTFGLHDALANHDDAFDLHNTLADHDDTFGLYNALAYHDDASVLHNTEANHGGGSDLYNNDESDHGDGTDLHNTDFLSEKPYLQRILYETEDESETVASALTNLNQMEDLRDMEGRPVSSIRWDYGCFQKKCGACAMRINGRPRLACDVKLKDLKKGRALLEPLKKFPVVEDLLVDRSILFENLKLIRAWFQEDAVYREKTADMAYEASRCLQCGICLEICPNFYPGGTFVGMAGFVPTAKLLSELPGSQLQVIREIYRRNIYEGCGKALSCRDVCPAGIDLEGLLVRSNAMAVWKRGLK
ncbi:MAG: hypothetical protein K5989_13080 [Lachnospiraceae bacterium]|nr:hypothetical protein [Lachnospiraceae bacterium]